MRTSLFAAVLITIALSAGSSLAQPSADQPELNQSDPFLEEDELFENASDPFSTYDEAASEAENVTLVDPSPVASGDEGDDGDQPPPPSDPGDEEDRSVPAPGMAWVLTTLTTALLVGRRP